LSQKQGWLRQRRAALATKQTCSATIKGGAASGLAFFLLEGSIMVTKRVVLKRPPRIRAEAARGERIPVPDLPMHVVRRSPQPVDNRAARYEMIYCDIASLAPYPQNPRDNEAAVESVCNSIKLVGFIVPVVIDRENVLVCGHTRVEAAKKLQLADVPAIYADSLTEAQINAFRLIDNKTHEASKWDFDLLSGELNKLTASGINFTEFGWSREELDCLRDVVASDCLDSSGLIDLEADARRQREARRSPATARYVLGEIVFFIPVTEYRAWVDDLRTEFDFHEENIVTEIKYRLGLVERPE
jgi:hypothetical protein